MKKKILIVEDEEMLAKVLVEQFNKAGFDVEAVFDGEEALESLKKSAPDLVLLDIILPKKDGFEVLKEIKENPDTQDIPVIMISNLGSDEDIKQSIKLGAADYYVKAQHPIYEITEKVSKFLSVPKSPLGKAKAPAAEKKAAVPLKAAERKPAEVIAEKPIEVKKALERPVEEVIEKPKIIEKPVEKIAEKIIKEVAEKPVIAVKTAEVKKAVEKPIEKISPPAMPTGRQVGGEKIVEKKPFDLAQGKPAEII
ncbi:MAG: response regulator, partial [Patescibacteria group bacterium]